MSEPRVCLVHVFHPGNVLAAYSAVKWYGSITGRGSAKDVVTLVHCPGKQACELDALIEPITRMAISQGWSTPRCIADAELSVLTTRASLTPYSSVLSRVRAALGRGTFDEIYYTVDMGPMPSLLMNAYESATRIMVGDAMGSVYNMNFHLALAGGSRKRQDTVSPRFRSTLARCRGWMRSVARCGRHVLLGGQKTFSADAAVLILPMDQTGDSIDKAKLHIVPKELVREVVATCVVKMPELRNYISQLISNSCTPRFLVLLENIADGGFASFDNEVLLYEEMVRTYAPTGSTVFVKGHPLSSLPVDQALCVRLSQDYHCRIVGKEFSRYPMEFWTEMVTACTVISMSYCSVSLPYLYQTKVLYPDVPSLMRKYIHSQYWDSYLNSDQICRGLRNGLNGWDRRSVIWSGKKEP